MAETGHGRHLVSGPESTNCGCCAISFELNRKHETMESIKQEVKTKYASVATSGLSTRHEGVQAVAQAFGYTEEELASIPAEANMGLS